MICTRVVVIFLTLIYFNCETLSDNVTCKTCQPRHFGQKFEECACQIKQFCNEISGKCIKCGNCFDYWNDASKRTKDSIESTLETLVKRYEINLGELQKLLTTLSENVKQQENEVHRLNNFSGTVDKGISNISKNIKQLKDDLRKIEETLMQVKSPTDPDLIKDLGYVRSTINELMERLKKIRFDIVDKNKLLELTEKLNDIKKYILNFDKNFPRIDLDSLNIALQIESDLDLLQLVIQKYNDEHKDESKFPKNVNDSMKWIENDIMSLIGLIKIYQNFSTENQELIKNATNVKSTANDTASELAGILRDLENFEKSLDRLKKENNYYQEIRKLQERLNTISHNVQKLDALMNALKELDILDNELEEYNKELKEVKKIIQELHKQKMDKLLNEELEQIKVFREMKNIKNVDKLRTDIAEMIKEVEKITDDIINKCKSATI